MKHRANRGLTLVEIMVAVVILAVGVLAAAAMQTTSLGLSGSSESKQEVVRLAQTELKLQRNVDHATTTSSTCLSTLSSGYSCAVARTSCELVSGNINCSSSVSSPQAHQVSVTVTGPRNASLVLQSLVPVKVVNP